MNLKVMTEQDFSLLMTKIESLEEKVDALNNNGVGTKQVYNIKDACDYLQTSRRTLQRYRDKGMLGFSQIGDKIYFKPSDLETFLAIHHVAPFNKKVGFRYE